MRIRPEGRVAIPIIAAMMLAAEAAHAPPAQAQDNDSDGVEWKFTGIWGGTRAPEPAGGLTAAMRDAGFGETVPDEGSSGSTAIPGETYPVRDDHGAGWRIEAHRNLSDHFGIFFVMADGALGSVVGYAEPDPGDPGVDLILTYSVGMQALAGSFSPLPYVHLFLGPALHNVSTSHHVENTETEITRQRIGGIGGLGISVPIWRELSIEARATFRYVGDVTIGPYSTTNEFGNSATLPPTSVDFNHQYWGLGLGWVF